MKIRYLLVLTGLAISFALPTFAQSDLADSETTQKVFSSVFKGWDEAQNNYDAAALAAHFTRDAVIVTADGPIIGREAIQKYYTDQYQEWHPKNQAGKVDGEWALHVIGTGGKEFWASGEWSQISQGKNGEPIPVKGHWLDIYVREGDDWKIRVTAWNITPDSVLLINKSFPQPATTPSPTASPSSQ